MDAAGATATLQQLCNCLHHSLLEAMAALVRALLIWAHLKLTPVLQGVAQCMSQPL